MTWPQPFHLPIFKKLNLLYEVEVDYYCLDETGDRGWGQTDYLFPIRHRYRGVGVGKYQFALPWSLFSAVWQGVYDCVVIGGWERTAHILLHEVCARSRVPVVVGSDLRSGPGGRAQRKRYFLKRLIRKPVLHRILKNAGAALGSGEAARQHFKELGFQGFLEKRFFGVDYERFHTPIKRTANEAVSILYAGRLISKKRVNDLILAVSRFHSLEMPTQTTIAGDGPCLPVLRKQVDLLGLTECVHFLGAYDHGRLPDIMQQADIFVLPGEKEPWGAVLVEAAAAGLAIVCTDEVGSAMDVVKNGVNGTIYPVGDIEALHQSLLYWNKQRVSMEWDQLRWKSRSLALDFSFDQCARTYWKAIQYVTKQSE